MIDHTLIKYMLFCTYLDLLPLNLIYFVLENCNYILENNISLAVGTMKMKTERILTMTDSWVRRAPNASYAFIETKVK